MQHHIHIGGGFILLLALAIVLVVWAVTAAVMVARGRKPEQTPFRPSFACPDHIYRHPETNPFPPFRGPGASYSPPSSRDDGFLTGLVVGDLLGSSSHSSTAYVDSAPTFSGGSDFGGASFDSGSSGGSDFGSFDCSW